MNIKLKITFVLVFLENSFLSNTFYSYSSNSSDYYFYLRKVLSTAILRMFWLLFSIA